MQTTLTSVTLSAMHLPARMKKGTPDQRQLSISSRSATKVSVLDFGVDALDVAVALVLAAHVALRVRRRHRLEQVELLSRIASASVAGRRGLHRDQGEHLQQVVLDDVAQRTDRVVEAAAVLDSEVLGHRDLHVTRRSWRFQTGSRIEFANRR